jgi:hypothetical protein
MVTPILVRNWRFKIFKTAWFLLISLLTGRSLGPAEMYINHDVASSVCYFIYDDVNAETMYETYTNIDILTVLIISMMIYILTITLLEKIRK